MNKLFLLFLGLFFPVFLFSQTTFPTPFENEIDSIFLQADSLIFARKMDEGYQLLIDTEKRALEKLEKDHPVFIRSNAAFGLYYFRKNEAEHSLVKDSLAIFLVEKHNKVQLESYPNILQRMSIIKTGQRKFEEAKTLILKAKDVLEQKNPFPASQVLLTYTQLANIYRESGQPERSELALEEGKAMAITHGITESHNYFFLLRDIGVFKIRTGRYQDAIEPLIAAKKGFEKSSKDRMYIASANINLSHAYSKIHQYDKAEMLLLDAKEIITEQLGTDNQYYFTCLFNLSALYGYMEDDHKSIKIKEELHPLIIKRLGKTHPLYIQTLNGLAKKYIDLAEYEKGKTLLEEDMDLLKQHYGPININYANTAGHLGVAKLIVSGGKEGAVHIQEAAKVKRAILAKGFRFLLETELADYAKSTEIKHRNSDFNLADLFLDNKILAEVAYDNNLFYKGFLLSTTKNFRVEAQKNPNNEVILTQFQELNAKIAEVLSLPIAEQGALPDLEQEAKAIEKELILKIGLKEDPFRIYNWQEVQAALPPKSAALEFCEYLATDNTNPDHKFHMAILLKPGMETPKCISLYQDLEMKNFKDPRALYAAQHMNEHPNLNDLVWKKLSKYLEDVETIYYAPSGLLHRINFGAIPISDSNDSETISDRFELHNMTSTRQVISPLPSSKLQFDEIAIFGGIKYESNSEQPSNFQESNSEAPISAGRSLGTTYRSYRGNDWRYLEWTKKEADDIHQQLEHTGAEIQSYIGYEASEEAFKNLSITSDNPSSPNVIHLATHGYFFPDVDTSAATGIEAAANPLIRSGLILAGANDAWKGIKDNKEGEDGILTAYEISQMDLSDTELVVLSACETGLGDIQGSEGVYGLQRAFKLAGVKYILMSLWRVKDKKTYEFMTSFYEKMLKGESIPKAYQQTQNEMRRKNNVPFNPKNWAGFVLIE